MRPKPRSLSSSRIALFWRSEVSRMVQRPIASATVRRQGFARCACRLAPPLTATLAPAQRYLAVAGWRPLRSLTTGSNTKFLTDPALALALLIMAAIVDPRRLQLHRPRPQRELARLPLAVVHHQRPPLSVELVTMALHIVGGFHLQRRD